MLSAEYAADTHKLTLKGLNFDTTSLVDQANIRKLVLGTGRTKHTLAGDYQEDGGSTFDAGEWKIADDHKSLTIFLNTTTGNDQTGVKTALPTNGAITGVLGHNDSAVVWPGLARNRETLDVVVSGHAAAVSTAVYDVGDGTLTLTGTNIGDGTTICTASVLAESTNW